MNEDNKNTELDNTDKKLHIPVVSGSCWKPTVRLRLNKRMIGWGNMEKIQQMWIDENGNEEWRDLEEFVVEMW